LRRQMYGRQIIFHLAHPADAFLPTVADLPYVQQSQAADSKLLLSLDNPEQHNPDLIRRLVNAGAEIQFVGESRRTLEEIYLQLVQEDGVDMDAVDHNN
jgi:ABC-2 type transport system ATP-binding protein